VKNSQSRWIQLALLLLSLSLTSQVFAWSDTDRDGVPDIKDACPNTEPNTPVMANGCVEEAAVEMTASPVCDMSHSNAELNTDCHNISAAMVYFEFAIAEVDFSQWKTLALVKAFLETNDAELTLVGHTDIVGTSEFNYQLSLQRAQNVKRILVEDYGFNPNRFTVIGKGISEPVADNRSSEGRSLNRRVEFIVNNK